MKRKGFIFSLDALFAVVLLIIGTSMILLFVYPENPGMAKVSFMEQNTHDSAITGFYQNKKPTDYGLSSAPDPASEHYFCYKTFKYEFVPEEDTTQGGIIEKNFCEDS